MKDYEMAYAMTDISEDLLLEAERPAAGRRTMKFHRIAAVAAIIAMLAVTVGAVAVGITWHVEKERGEDVIERFGGIALDYYKDYDGTQSFEKVALTVPLEKVGLPEQNMDKIKALTRQMDPGEPGEDVRYYVQNYKGHYIIPEDHFVSAWTMADVENLLGITLDLPEPLREALLEAEEESNAAIWVRLYARTAEATGELEPTRVEISFQLFGFATNGQATGSITVALTEEAAREGMLVESYSYEREGAIWQEEQTVGGRELVIYGNDPEAGYEGSAGAVYASDGIGYHVSARRDADIPFYSPSWPCYNSAKEMVLSLFDNLE